MSLTLPAYVVSHKADASRRFVWLLEIAATSTTPLVRLTDCELDVAYLSNLYPAGRSFTVASMQTSFSGIGEFTLSVGNNDGVVGGYLAKWVGPDARPRIILSEVWFDATTTDLTVQGGYQVASGVADALNWDDKNASIRVVPSASSSQLLSHGMKWERDRCTYRAFKGPECGYAGVTATCDRTPAACAGMAGGSNILRFGGVRSGFDGFLYEAGTSKQMWYADWVFNDWQAER